jgi:glutaredoxin
MYLREKGISYEEKNISIDTASRTELMKRGIRGVPAFIIGEEVVVGLDTSRIESLIDYLVVNCPKCPARLRVPKDKGKITVTCPNCSNEFKMHS